jgi:hypothetical protein
MIMDFTATRHLLELLRKKNGEDVDGTDTLKLQFELEALLLLADNRQVESK